jgi:hypothetical protein
VGTNTRIFSRELQTYFIQLKQIFLRRRKKRSKAPARGEPAELLDGRFAAVGKSQRRGFAENGVTDLIESKTPARQS